MLWPILFAIAAAIVLIAAVACAWLLADRRSSRARTVQLQEALDQAQAESASLRQRGEELDQRLAQADRDLAVAAQQQKAFDQRYQDLRQQHEAAQKQARDTFQSLAGDALKAANEQFLQLARKSFESEQKQAVAQLDQRKQAIDNLVKPVRETLEKYNQAIQQIETARKEAYGSLRTQVGALLEDQRRLREETGHLVQALRRPEVRGRWGEMQLRRVAELAGMIPYCDFVEQASINGSGNGEAVNGEGVRLRPDMIVNLPSHRQIVVDAKTPISAFIDATECDDDDQRRLCLERHVRHIETQIKSLSAKQYQEQFDRSPDFVVLFIPGESFLQAAVQIKPTLIEAAMRSNVLIASPTTLISLLKAVAVGWREEQIAQSAQRISELGIELHSRLGTAFDHLTRLGKSLGSTITHFNKLVGSLESSVLPQARRFEELGADSHKKLPDALDGIDTIPRELTRLEPTKDTPRLAGDAQRPGSDAPKPAGESASLRD